MFVRSKPLPIHTKIWQQAGLDFLFIPEEERRTLLKNKADTKPSVQNYSNIVNNIPLNKENSTLHQKDNVDAVNKKFNIDNKTISSTNKQVLEQNISNSPRSSEEARELSENEIVYNSQGKALASLPKIIKSFEWSEEWEELFKKIARSNAPKIAWTYAGLHADILKNTYSNANRQEIVRDLVTNLNYKKAGSNVFVPFDMPTESTKLYIDTMKNDAVFFWSSLLRLKVKVLFVFGEEAREALLLKKSSKYTSFMHNAHAHYKVYYLPDILSLSERSERNSLLTYLNQQLSSIVL